MMKVLVILFLLFTTPSIHASRRAPKVRHDIPWDPRITYQLQFGQIHTIDVLVDEYMDIFCPQYDADASSTMKFTIYNVSGKSFNECSLAADAKPIFKCDSPSISKKLTTKFQRRSPNPMGFVFKPGHSYYYMSFVKMEDGKYSCDNALRLAINVHHKKSVHAHTKASLPATRSVIQTTKSKPSTTTQTIRSSKPPNTKTSPKTSSLVLTKTSTRLVAVENPNTLERRGTAASVRCSHLWIIIACFLAIFLYT